MGRKKAGRDRVLTPFQLKDGRWRVVAVEASGERSVEHFATEGQARRRAQELEDGIEARDAITVHDAMELYEKHLLVDEGNSERGVKTTLYRLRTFFTSDRERVVDLSAKRCLALYESLRTRKKLDRKGNPTTETYSVDHHRNTLAEVKTFLRWCVKERYLHASPAEEIEGKGKRNKGKEQLTIDEAGHWLAKAIDVAEAGESGALAAMITLLFGLRASEIVRLKVRDVDAGGTILRVQFGKSRAARRKLRIPDEVQPYFQGLTVGREGEDLLFGYHERGWPCDWVQTICRKARLPEVTAHGMRGLHADIALEEGESPYAVMRSMGHSALTTTRGNYARPGAGADAQRERVFTVITGGAAREEKAAS